MEPNPPRQTYADLLGEVTLTAASAAVGVRKLVNEADADPELADHLAHHAMEWILEQLGAKLHHDMHAPTWGGQGEERTAVRVLSGADELPEEVREALAAMLGATDAAEDKGQDEGAEEEGQRLARAKLASLREDRQRRAGGAQ